MTLMIASQQQPTKEEAEEEAEEEEGGRIQCQEEGLREEEVSTEYSTVLCTHLDLAIEWEIQNCIPVVRIELHALLKIYFDNV